jgi:hypothetical protein
MATKQDTLVPSDPKAAQILREQGRTYLSRMPMVVPAGRVLVHNNLRPTRRFGVRGFRAWLQNSTDGLERCDCGFAPLIATHYRVRPPHLS